MDKITKNIKISDLIEKEPKAAEILFQYGMGCLGCPSAQHETLEQAAMSHGINLDELLKVLNTYV